ncbi:hypothetical protein O7631_30395 [Micromonospora sp. WMMD967]|uniref:hypothetical protein n=1 Tax=Micromonospora sp. WMMD967 TaxID=3016101 RepID=UPI002415CA3D|nr:hypothetical protein [Micromonospora sp. WMMD967]MDG4840858.1 hypothetical protein [Micromonospora sp. WMMD967]
MAAALGLRRGELLGLRWSNLDLDNGTATIGQTVQRAGGELRLQDTKTEDSDSVLPLPDWTWLALLDHQERQQREWGAACRGLAGSRPGLPLRSRHSDNRATSIATSRRSG